MPITKWKNIMLAPTPEKRDELVDKLTEKEAKVLIKFLVSNIRGYATLEDIITATEDIY